MVIGITGSIATGKSLVGSYFRKKGYQVIDSDQINSDLLKDKKHITNINKLLFNKDSDILNRKEVAKEIFSNNEQRLKLNNYLHPRIYKIISNLINKDDSLVFIEVPLLFETNFIELVDKTIVVYTNEEIQIKRLISRDKITFEEALIKIKSQMRLTEKIKRADYLIDNNNSKTDTYKQLDNLLNKLLKE